MKKFLILLFLISLVACKNSNSTPQENILKPELDILKKHQINTKLSVLSKEKIKAWNEYETVNNDLKKYTNISANEALNNAVELAKNIKYLKDSIRPKELINNSFRTRVNVLENESLRLKDMTLIRNAITVDAINLQVDKVLNAFSATNSKINTIYSQLEIEKEISNNQN
jgi:hypothetical protein